MSMQPSDAYMPDNTVRAVEQAVQQLQPGKYVVAVSGGVDSMVLLDAVTRQPQLEIVVAHVDHGIRPDSGLDYQLVQAAANQNGLAFYGLRVKLGAQASEAIARQVRYAFLLSVQARVGARSLLTAHHQDDLIESVAIQVLRGSGRLGLTPLGRKNIVRPFLQLSKAQLITYANQHGLSWREDSTNTNLNYVRNRLRAGSLHSPAEDLQAKRQKLMAIVQGTGTLNEQVDLDLQVVDAWLDSDIGIRRDYFALLPHKVAKEFLAWYLRQRQVMFNAPLLEKLTIGLKVQKANTWLPVSGSARFKIDKKTAKLLVQ